MGLNFPITLDQSTVIGRASLGSGPAEEIPFARLATSLGVGSAFQISTSIAGTNTITGVTVAAAPLAAGQVIFFIPANTNSGATTFNRDGLGAKNIFVNGTALVGGEIVANVPTELFYDGVQYNLLYNAFVSLLNFAESFSVINGSLTASVATNALTIALKGINGNDPSASNPVTVAFRNVTAGTGTPAVVQVTAPTSIVVPAGASLGTSNGVLGRIWVVAFNDGGTFRLGVVNCLSGTSIFALRDNILASSTLTPASSAQVIYTTVAAVTAKAMRILGYLDATETVAGTWATAPSKVQLFGPGVAMPGEMVQMQRNETGALATGTTAMVWDDTIPQLTEGDQYMSQAITPTSAANVLCIEAQVVAANSNSSTVQFIASITQDSNANSLSAIANPPLGGASQPQFLHLKHRILSGTTSSTTFGIRAGGITGATTTFNGSAGARKLGGVSNSFVEVTEIMA